MFYLGAKSCRKCSICVADTDVIPMDFIETEGFLFSQKGLLDGSLFLRLLPCMNLNQPLEVPLTFVI